MPSTTVKNINMIIYFSCRKKKKKRKKEGVLLQNIMG